MFNGLTDEKKQSNLIFLLLLAAVFIYLVSFN
jgi:hypothetical protein